jgi:hypothetical protein
MSFAIGRGDLSTVLHLELSKMFVATVSNMKNFTGKGELFTAANAPAFREAPVFSRGPPSRRDRGARSRRR